jgi:hypothetical protein
MKQIKKRVVGKEGFEVRKQAHGSAGQLQWANSGSHTEDAHTEQPGAFKAPRRPANLYPPKLVEL